VQCHTNTCLRRRAPLGQCVLQKVVDHAVEQIHRYLSRPGDGRQFERQRFVRIPLLQQAPPFQRRRSFRPHIASLIELVQRPLQALRNLGQLPLYQLPHSQRIGFVAVFHH